MNECGGMNDIEFFCYIVNVICALYPDMADVEGSCVVLKVDSGPGRWGRKLMLMARFRGLYIYPLVPNATSVQQEKNVSYGPFKGVVRKNLERIALACHAAGKSIRVGQSTFGMIVYGGICPVSGVECRNALKEKFCVSSNLLAWAAVGAVPFTKKCLENPKVRHDRTDERGPNFDVYQDIQSQNDYAVVQLNAMGYQGDVLRAQFLVDKVRARSAVSLRTVTVAHSREKQFALTAANTAGKKFHATGGGSHITTDDMWITMERTWRDGLVEEKEKEKKCRLKGNRRRDAALLVLDRLDNQLSGNVDALKGNELTTLLKWKGVKASYMGNNVADEKALYKQIVKEGSGGGGVDSARSWTDANEEELEELKNAMITMSDTAYGRYKAEMKRDTIRACMKMSAKEKEEVLRIFAETEAAKNNTPV
jgi:hypothetical protein